MTFSTAVETVNRLFAGAAVNYMAYHTHCEKVQTIGTSEILISFPGIKSTATKKDYRVDLRRATTGAVAIPLSHTNVAVDLYWKANGRGVPRQTLVDWLDGLFSDQEPLRDPAEYSVVAIPEGILVDVRNLHFEIGKKFNTQPHSEELTFSELAACIRWIAAQEDINYPQPRYQGRRRSLFVYTEAVSATGIAAAGDSPVSLKDVVQRAHSTTGRLKPIVGVHYPSYLQQ